MDFLFVALLIFSIPVWIVRRELRRRADPDYWRKHGAVVLRPEAFDAHGEPIGYYDGVDIFRTVRFQNHEYRFDRVAPHELRELTRAGELYLEPGLVYVMIDRGSARR